MALDGANFIAELSITDPPGSDPLSQGDDQIRTCKRATQQSFPNIAAAVTLTQDQLNLAAIKNEANVFTITRNRFTNQIDCIKSGPTQLAGHFYYDDGDFARWGWFMSTLANGEPMTLQRRDALGVLIDLPFQVRLTDGVAEFTVPPEIGGAPLWIAGEIRQFAIAASPGANWFLADGTNGTKNLADRWLVGAGAFAGAVGTDLEAKLDTVTAIAGVTGSTAINTSQMPSHNHAARDGNAGGITDSTIGAVSTETVMGGSRGSPGGKYTNLNSTGNEIIQSTGGGAGHTHTSPAQTMAIGSPTFTNAVQPVSVAVETYQYVP